MRMDDADFNNCISTVAVYIVLILNLYRHFLTVHKCRSSLCSLLLANDAPTDPYFQQHYRSMQTPRPHRFKLTCPQTLDK